jgi:hypothetical protein
MASERILVVGTRQKDPGLRKRDEWHDGEEGVVAYLDPSTGRSEVCFRYRSPAHLCPSGASAGFLKAASWDQGSLLLCTATEVVRVDPRTWEVSERWTHRWMNDVHHAVRRGSALHVVSTGLDGLLELDTATSRARLRPALDEDLWTRFDPEQDWRRVATTKPHRSHPNFTFETRHGVWLTRFLQQDAICLDEPARRIAIEVGHPHDGHVVGDRVWFTTTNGHVVEADAETAKEVAVHDLNAIEGDGEPLGWCRGLLVQGSIAWVGVSRLRSTIWRDNLRWLKRGLEGHRLLPTRVVAYDLARREPLGQWEVESRQINAIYSILELPEGPGSA